MTITVHSLNDLDSDRAWEDLCEIAEQITDEIENLVLKVYGPGGQKHRPGLNVVPDRYTPRT